MTPLFVRVLTVDVVRIIDRFNILPDGVRAVSVDVC
jgi:hypothetical protein